MIVVHDRMGEVNIICMLTIISMSCMAIDKLDDTTVNQDSSTESAETHSFWPGC